MSRKRPKSELERYVDSAVVSLLVEDIRSPEEWVRWGSLVFAWLLIVNNQFIAGLVLIVLGLALHVRLMRMRVGAKDPTQLFARMLPKMAINNAQRELRRGVCDAKVGPEARALLESCAVSANAIIETASRAITVDGGGRPAVEAFKPLTNGAAESMKEALARQQHAIVTKRLPDEEALAELRATDRRLASLRDEAKRLAREFKTSSALGEPLDDPTARADALRELDQGA